MKRESSHESLYWAFINLFLTRFCRRRFSHGVSCELFPSLPPILELWNRYLLHRHNDLTSFACWWDDKTGASLFAQSSNLAFRQFAAQPSIHRGTFRRTNGPNKERLFSCSTKARWELSLRWWPNSVIWLSSCSASTEPECPTALRFLVRASRKTGKRKNGMRIKFHWSTNGGSLYSTQAPNLTDENRKIENDYFL